MASEGHPDGSQHRQAGSCVLFQSPDQSIVLIDVPRSIEEAQVLPGQAVRRRLISSSPIDTPWETPEPRKSGAPAHLTSPSAAVAELMTLESARAALRRARLNYRGPWCLPRVINGTGKLPDGDDGEPHQEESRKRKRPVSPATDAVSAAVPPLIPDQSRYLLGSVRSQREAFLADAPAFDLVVLDPPWPSRSVKRKQNSYATAYGVREAGDLLAQIPVASRLKPEGLVAVWVTNKTAVADLLTSPGGIFSRWDVESVGEWVWLKITRTGDPIVDLEAQWRKPWERLLLARRKNHLPKAPIPTKVILAVPDVHSRKPNLRLLFKDILPENYNGLEVFARNLTAGWWSWGDEVLRFQQQHHWVEAIG
ncbi:MT-A70-domain-containing protein [Durotheca rogersii]|uniref:MT-A70-domain-containing protein n=1 Tax=Durotheca rogersii TaxID=419775 RepID=UPI0022204398|nr:MT-A70-domain-containing protein [Durotheca rogersii]KAI5868510.1 MT-A70-domain-containing protein [Durotheca rogersii]